VLTSLRKRKGSHLKYKYLKCDPIIPELKRHR
jgi:hypothetical protein